MINKLLRTSLIARYRKNLSEIKEIECTLRDKKKKLYNLSRTIKRYIRIVKKDFEKEFPGWTILLRFYPDSKCHVMEFSDKDFCYSASKKDGVYKGVFILTEDSFFIRKPIDNIFSKDTVKKTKMKLNIRSVIQFFQEESQKTGIPLVIHKHKYVENVTEADMSKSFEFDAEMKDLY